ncbi:Response regulatory domain-containing protein [Pseudozyma hubeiensis]|nr:Response regulatory domain-containing protein [Pseudozyma hubeiensis]
MSHQPFGSSPSSAYDPYFAAAYSSASSSSSCHYASSSSSPCTTPPPPTAPSTAAAAAAALGAASMMCGSTCPEDSLPFVVLVVDDNPINRKVLTIPLRKQGIEVVEAENGLEAVQRYAQVRPALVLMDISMPIMDGFEATRQIRMHEQAQSCNPPDLEGTGALNEVISMVLTHQRARIVAATTHSSDRDFDEGKQAGMDDWMLKPIRPSVLVQDILEYRRNHLQEFAATLGALGVAGVGVAAGEAAVEMVMEQAGTPNAAVAATIAA